MNNKRFRIVTSTTMHQGIYDSKNQRMMLWCSATEKGNAPFLFELEEWLNKQFVDLSVVKAEQETEEQEYRRQTLHRLTMFGGDVEGQLRVWEYQDRKAERGMA